MKPSILFTVTTFALALFAISPAHLALSLEQAEAQSAQGKIRVKCDNNPEVYYVSELEYIGPHKTLIASGFGPSRDVASGSSHAEERAPVVLKGHCVVDVKP